MAASFPLKETEAQGWISREASLAGQTGELFRYFGVSPVEAYRLLGQRTAAYHPHKHCLYVGNSGDWGLVASGEIAVEQLATEPFDVERLRSALLELREVSRLKPEEQAARLRGSYAQAGVVVVLVPASEDSALRGSIVDDLSVSSDPTRPTMQI